ncbi:hypothetical protein FACS1894122_03170 [Alphaproteobacteria bacterium]|nr:hypothetical protein FACS1894122_03170 [Alphaproteobacteria bacterium]
MDGARVIGARFNGSDISTNIGFLHEEGHPESRQKNRKNSHTKKFYDQNLLILSADFDA